MATLTSAGRSCHRLGHPYDDVLDHLSAMAANLDVSFGDDRPAAQRSIGPRPPGPTRDAAASRRHPLGRAGMDDEPRERCLRELVSAADRLDALADTAELMGDDDGAARFRAEASKRRLQAMALLDH